MHRSIRRDSQIPSAAGNLYHKDENLGWSIILHFFRSKAIQISKNYYKRISNIIKKQVSFSLCKSVLYDEAFFGLFSAGQ